MESGSSPIPRVSICLPTLNSRQFLEERVGSILEQDFEDWELIVGDSFSNDGTWEYFQQFKDDQRFRLFQIPKDGLFPGWNQCLAKVRGDFIHIATSDDTMRPGFLDTMVACLDGNEDAAIASCNFDFINASGEQIAPTQGIPGAFFGEWAERKHVRKGVIDFMVHTLLGTSWTTVTSILFRRSLLEQVGLFRVDADNYADRFWAMVASLHADLVHTPERLATWRIHGGQSSSCEQPGWRKENIRLTEETLRNHRNRIESLFPNPDSLEEQLLHGVKRYQLEEYGLDRMNLKRRPLSFLRGCWQAALDNPSYLKRRLVSCLEWEDESIESYTERLIDELGLPWPPAVKGDQLD